MIFKLTRLEPKKNLLKRYLLLERSCLYVKVWRWTSSRSSTIPWFDNSNTHCPLEQSWTMCIRCCSQLDGISDLPLFLTRIGHWKRPYFNCPLSSWRVLRPITWIQVWFVLSTCAAPSNRPTWILEKRNVKTQSILSSTVQHFD